MTLSYIAPAITGAFNCPHCGVLAHQTWYKTYGDQYDRDSFPLRNITQEEIDNLEQEENPAKGLAKYLDLLNKAKTGRPFLELRTGSANFLQQIVNLNVSRCFSCDELSIWRYESLIYPSRRAAVPNADLPPDIKADFIEAAEILDLSPRGSAALLRLCIQKLCIHLGEKVVNINYDIASLVGKGLDPEVQKALDIVRVIGNEAVHPGELDLHGNPEIAVRLFTLVNYITEELISRKRVRAEMLKIIPQSKLDGIEQRNAKAREKSTTDTPPPT